MSKLLLIAVLLTGIAAFSYAGANAQLEPMASLSALSSQQAPPSIEQPDWSSEPPVLTEEQKERLEYWLDHTNLSGPIFTGTETEAAGPAPGTESTVGSSSDNPAAGSLMESRTSSVGNSDIFVDLIISKLIPADCQSNAGQGGLGAAGEEVFYTGNGFAARRNADGEETAEWQFANSYADFPSFCCDQIGLYDPSRDTHFWLRMGAPGENGENEFKLGVSTDACQTFAIYTVRPTGVDGSWTNQRWDHPYMELGAGCLYLSLNVLDASGAWMRSVMLRFPLNELIQRAGFLYAYYQSSEWSTFVPVSVVEQRIFWASKWPAEPAPSSKVGIWAWDEGEAAIQYTTIGR